MEISCLETDMSHTKAMCEAVLDKFVVEPIRVCQSHHPCTKSTRDILDPIPRCMKPNRTLNEK